ncbi:hypothetical protein [Celeribacter halophilus]|nr:hypothetical protein [Celeribacter halophilus]
MPCQNGLGKPFDGNGRHGTGSKPARSAGMGIWRKFRVGKPRRNG